MVAAISGSTTDDGSRTTLKEIYLDKYAELFAQSGIASLVFDHRCFGASDGAPRQELDPLMQIRDWRDAISFATPCRRPTPRASATSAPKQNQVRCSVCCSLPKPV
jgi:hypothetical protein